MLLTTILGTINVSPASKEIEHIDPAGRRIETITLHGDDLQKRVLRVHSDAGKEYGITLPKSSRTLADGDVLVEALDHLVVVSSAATDVLVIEPATMHQMGFVAHSLGNRHLPAQFTEQDAAAEMIVAYDHTVTHFLDEHGVPYRREQRVLPEPLRHAEHTH